MEAAPLGSDSPYYRITERILGPISCDATEAQLLRGFRNAGGVYTDLASLVESHPHARGNLIRFATEHMADKSEGVSLSVPTALSFLGFETSRNFLAASIVRGHPDSLKPGTQEVIKTLFYALRGENRVGEKSPLRLDYFVSGLVFDFLRTTFRDAPAQLFESSWEHAETRTKIALQLAAEWGLPQHALKDLCLDGMLHDVGRIVLTLFDPKYPDLLEEDLLTERKRYSFDHGAYGYLLLQRMGITNETAMITLYHHKPFLTSKLENFGEKRATLIWLADTLSRYKKSLAAKSSPKPSKTLINQWQVCCQKVFRMKSDSFFKAIERNVPES